MATERVARHELCALAKEITALETDGRLTVQAVKIRTPAHATFKQLHAAGADRGEAEAIAWAVHSDRPWPIFVTCDSGARRHALQSGLRVWDSFDVVLACINLGALSEAEAARQVAVWEDQRKSFGRPPDFTTFADTAAKRHGRGRST